MRWKSSLNLKNEKGKEHAKFWECYGFFLELGQDNL